MDQKTYNYFDILVKILGFLATAASIFIGITQFNKQQKSAIDLELRKNFWESQNRVYIEICNNAGAMAANAGNKKKFDKEKIKFLTNYYGQMVLVEDPKVDSTIVELRSY